MFSDEPEILRLSKVERQILETPRRTFENFKGLSHVDSVVLFPLSIPIPVSQ